MKEDYLWDKTGEDPEIKRLEDLLQTFRYHETASPTLPAEVINVEKESLPSFFAWFPMRFAAAAAACLAIATVLAVGVLFQLSQPDPNAVIATNIKSEKSVAVPQNPKKADLPVNNPVTVKPNFIVSRANVNQQTNKFQKTIQPVAHHNKLTVPKVEKIDGAERLTKEELYAYTQLMTALSITSSKLKVVKDKVEGVGN